MIDKIFAVVTDGVVTRVCELPAGFDLIMTFGPGPYLPAPHGVATGWLFDGETFRAPPRPGPVPVVVTEVSSAQAKLALLAAPGSAADKTLLDDVEAAVTQAGRAVQIWFTDARVWQRSNPNVIAVGTALGLDAAAIDALFVAASQIQD